MKTYTSFYKYQDALAYAQEQVKDFKDGYLEDGSVDCDKVDCPREMDSWSGETSAIFVCSEENGIEEVVAYWE
ncbi:MAG: hypothetical protein II260_02865 [Muribaculaceae bacterium]|nr:hypothetical protein [Muribaculaceae bacterium]